MAFHKSIIGNGIDDNKINNRYQSLTDNQKKSANFNSGTEVKPNPHDKPPSGQNPVGPMKGELMTWTQMLENMDDISDSVDEMSDNCLNASCEADDVPTMGAGNGGSDKDNDLLEQLNQIFTPILITQSFEGNNEDKIMEAYSEASVLTERNVIQFDDATRMSQLISVCALLLARQSNSQKYQMYQKAAVLKNKLKLEIQKENYAAAQALAQKYLVKVSTTNNSSVARQAANDLLPETQH